MASIIRIKRSGVTGSPSTLAQGELAYSFLDGTLTNGGDRLYLGTGTETNGAAVNVEAIGGKYFTSKLDHTPGIVTANSAIIVDDNLSIDQIFFGNNLQITSNTISTTTGNITIDPAGDFLIEGDTNINGILTINGAEISGNVNLDGDVIISGDLTVNGNTTVVGTSTLEVEDPLIKMARGNNTDSISIGFYGQYGASEFKSGWFRSHEDGGFYLFKDFAGDITTNNVIPLNGLQLADANFANINVANAAISGNADVIGTVSADLFVGEIDGGSY